MSKDRSESKCGACLDVAGKIRVEAPETVAVLDWLNHGSAASCRSRIKREVMLCGEIV